MTGPGLARSRTRNTQRPVGLGIAGSVCFTHSQGNLPHSKAVQREYRGDTIVLLLEMR
jgi:hypothetical protein